MHVRLFDVARLSNLLFLNCKSCSLWTDHLGTSIRGTELSVCIHWIDNFLAKLSGVVNEPTISGAKKPSKTGLLEQDTPFRVE